MLSCQEHQLWLNFFLKWEKTALEIVFTTISETIVRLAEVSSGQYWL